MDCVLEIARRVCKEKKPQAIFIIIFYSGSIFQEMSELCGKFCICCKIGNYREELQKTPVGRCVWTASGGCGRYKHIDTLQKYLEVHYKALSFQPLNVRGKASYRRSFITLDILLQSAIMRIIEQAWILTDRVKGGFDDKADRGTDHRG